MKWVSLFSIVLLLGCAKSTSCASAVKGKLKNLSGLDGCGWVIEANGKTYEPINLNSFDPSLLKDNQPIYFSFEPFQGGSICMVGETIQLKCVDKR